MKKKLNLYQNYTIKSNYSSIIVLSDSSYKTGMGTPHKRCLEIHQYGRFSIKVKRALRLPLSSG